MTFLLGWLLALTAAFLILLVLVQRGRGGGLSGALGGMGGQSAFGAKAGDVFTRITIGTAIFWILLCVASIKLLGGSDDRLSDELGASTSAPDGSVLTGRTGGPEEQTATPPAELPGAGDTGAPATGFTPPPAAGQSPAETPSPPSGGSPAPQPSP